VWSSGVPAKVQVRLSRGSVASSWPAGARAGWAGPAGACDDAPFRSGNEAAEAAYGIAPWSCRVRVRWRSILKPFSSATLGVRLLWGESSAAEANGSTRRSSMDCICVPARCREVSRGVARWCVWASGALIYPEKCWIQSTMRGARGAVDVVIAGGGGHACDVLSHSIRCGPPALPAPHIAANILHYAPGPLGRSDSLQPACMFHQRAPA
jgi:hypothetical protein